MTSVFEVTEAARAEMAKRKKRARDGGEGDSGGTPLHAAAEGHQEFHEQERKRREALKTSSFLPASVGQHDEVTLTTGQGGDHPEASVSRPGSATVQLVDLRDGTFPSRRPVNAVPFRQSPFHTAPINTGADQ